MSVSNRTGGETLNTTLWSDNSGTDGAGLVHALDRAGVHRHSPTPLLTAVDALWHQTGCDLVLFDRAWATEGADIIRSTVGDMLYDAGTCEPTWQAATPQQLQASVRTVDGVILVDCDGRVVPPGSWAACQPGVRRVYVSM